jgi:hypothetical protein
MLSFKMSSLFEVFALALTLSPTSASVLRARKDVSAQTTFTGWSGCDRDDIAMIKQAHKDALVLADAALDEGEELLATKGAESRYIDWKTRAALDYWGPRTTNAPWQEVIFDTFVRATQTYSGIGWDDFWANRYVFVRCDDPANDCGETSPAYTLSSPTNATYPTINYCPPFFDKRKSHGFQVARIKADTSGQLKKNLRNLRSQATTALHEWLHIREFSSEVCLGGCDDTWQIIGDGEKVQTYKAGRTKLLARMKPEQAAYTNDNYAYFAMSRFMEKNFKEYPAYPTAWDRTKSRKENEAIEAGQPGAPSEVQPWEIEDDDSAAIGDIIDASPLIAASEYPSWYRPIADAGATTSLPNISPPAETAAPMYAPDIDSIVCQTSDNSPFIPDCTYAFGTFNDIPDKAILHKNKTDVWWTSVSLRPRFTPA